MSTGQTRTFNYSTLSRPTSATNPGSETVNYTYYNNGNLHTRTDANGTVATFVYDGLNRPTGISYTPGTGVAATPSVTYTYDQGGFIGELSSVSSTASKTQFSYDKLGRITGSTQTTPNPGMPYSFTNYQYSLTDQLTSVTYSSGRKISYTLDAADQVTTVNGTPSGGTPTAYASSITYSAAGDLATLPFGNGITESHTWNSRFQQTGISAGNLLGLGYTYCPNGQAQCPSGNTGTPWQHTIAIGGRTRPANPPHGFAGRILTIASRPGAAGGRQCSRWRTKSW